MAEKSRNSGNDCGVCLSIIIVNWNTAELLRQCLKSIYIHRASGITEVIVVDNNSEDRSVNMLRGEFPQVKLIINQENEGFAKANNKAIRISKGSYVLLLNSDVEIIDDSINKMLEFIEANEKVGVVGCKLIDKSGKLQKSAAWFPSLATAIVGASLLPTFLARLFKVGRIPGQLYLSDEQHERTNLVDWVCGACLMIKRETINNAGLMDEALFMYGEEIEWCYRIKKMGWKVAYLPSAKVIHFRCGSSKSQSEIEIAYQRRVYAHRYIYAKYHSIYLARIHDCLLKFSAIIKLPVWWMLMQTATHKERALSRFFIHRASLKSMNSLIKLIKSS